MPTATITEATELLGELRKSIGHAKAVPTVLSKFAGRTYGDVGLALPIAKLPPTREAYDTELRAKGFTQYKAGYLPYSIIDGWQQVRKDFAYWRALIKAIETAATPEDRAWFEADRKRREAITLHDIGIWSHYVGDASQPLHVSIHFNGWGDFPNPKGYTTKPIHAYFEGEFVKRNLTRSAVGAEVSPYQPCACSIRQSTRALLLESMAEVEPFYALQREGAFKRGDPRGVAFDCTAGDGRDSPSQHDY